MLCHLLHYAHYAASTIPNRYGLIYANCECHAMYPVSSVVVALLRITITRPYMWPGQTSHSARQQENKLNSNVMFQRLRAPKKKKHKFNLIFHILRFVRIFYVCACMRCCKWFICDHWTAIIETCVSVSAYSFCFASMSGPVVLFFQRSCVLHSLAHRELTKPNVKTKM